MNNLLSNFQDYCKKRNWTINRFTSEFTLQFRFCRFFEESDNSVEIELESNINRYGYGDLTKKEIDIDLLFDNKRRELIEIKFIRDRGSFNIGMFKFCQDIRFIEEMCNTSNFSKGYAILFTNIEELYTRPKRPLNPRNQENLRLYECFRIDKELSGELQIKTGNTQGTVTLSGNYKLEWYDFQNNIQACIVAINP